MNIILNGQSETTDLTQLDVFLSEFTDTSQPYAVAINEQFIPKSLYTQTALNDGDRIEILSPMQGG